MEKKTLNTEELRYLKMQNWIFGSSGINPYDGEEVYNESGIKERLKDEEVLIIPKDTSVISGFIKWLYTGVEQEGFTRDMIMKKNRNISEYFDPGALQITTSAFIHSKERVALLRVKECYAYAENTLTMIQGHVDTSVPGMDDFIVGSVMQMSDPIEALNNFRTVLRENMKKEMEEELTYVEDENFNASYVDMYMDINNKNIDVVYAPYSDSLRCHIGVVFDVSVADDRLECLQVNEPDKHYGVELIYLDELHKHIHELDPWIIEYIATCKNDKFRKMYSEKVFDREIFEMVDEGE